MFYKIQHCYQLNVQSFIEADSEEEAIKIAERLMPYDDLPLAYDENHVARGIILKDCQYIEGVYDCGYGNEYEGEGKRLIELQQGILGGKGLPAYKEAKEDI